MQETVLKAARRALKKQNTDGDVASMKLRHLSKAVLATLEDTSLSKSQVQDWIAGSNQFTVVDKRVSLAKTSKTWTERKRPVTPPEDAGAGGSPKRPRTEPAAEAAELTDAADVAAWREQHRIAVRAASNDADASRRLAADDGLFPCATFAAAARAGIAAALVRHCIAVGKFRHPTPIQAQAWPVLCRRCDVVGIAETGSGKTLAFALPALSAMAAADAGTGEKPSKRQSPRMMVLAPTRELAMQSHVVLEEYGAVMGLKSLVVYGGVPKPPQVAALKQGDIACLVATPGRLKDLMAMGACRLSNIQYLVLDEADRMLDMGFEQDVRSIVKECPTKRLTAMFSATWPAAIQGIAMEFMRNPVRVYVGFESIVADDNGDGAAPDDSLSANKRVKQTVEVIEDRQRDARLRQILKQVHDGKNRVLIFALYKKEAERIEVSLRRDGFNVCSIHGNKQQSARTEALQGFKDGSCPLLVATDVAARGLDIPNVQVVINFTFPLTIEDYVHRIGRTGRAGSYGVSFTFFQPGDKSHAGELQQVMRQAGQDVPDELMKFGSTIKKKEHKLYGAFGPTGITKKATRIVFD